MHARRGAHGEGRAQRVCRAELYLRNATGRIHDIVGLHGVDILCKQLIAHGLPASTPAALIQQGTTPQQRVLTGDLTTLADIVNKGNVKAPTLIIVGEVVRLRDRLKWFEPELNR